MALVPGIELLRRAYEEGYAVGSFNINNMEILQAILQAAEEEKSPVMIQTSQGAIKYAGAAYLAAMVKAGAEQVSVPVALHLDHGDDWKVALQCLRYGWTSLMYDGSHLPLEENIRETRRVVEMAHAVGVSVEGELGRISGVEEQVAVSEREAFFTDPEEAEIFVRETGVDYLAVSIGTAHGLYKGKPDLDFPRLEEIQRRVKIPIVLHGGSGVPEDQIKKAISLGVAKINIDTELRQAFLKTMREKLEENPNQLDPRKVLGPGRDAMVAVVKEKMRLFGSSGKAR
ncbi:MAG: class II fructose-1,6-bisphosphate aldolase [Clostridiales bacterium]|nr:class II fructose-1,6-bisphosphate aldolase [Clostridiales bacterium]